MNRRVILLGAGVILAVAIFLVVKVRSDDSGASAGTRTDDPSDPTPVATERGTDPGTHTDPANPSLPVEGQPPVRETVVDGIRVRDHRTGDHGPITLPDIHRHDPQRLPPDVVKTVLAQLQPALKECTAQIPQEARNPKSRLAGSVVVGIKDGTLSVNEANVGFEDVTGEIAGAKSCFEKKAVGQTVPAAVGDKDHYTIVLRFKLP